MPVAVAAVGGNALAGALPGEVDRERLEREAIALARLVALGWDTVVTHGNGPQVGARLQSAHADGARVSLDVLDAETQGSLGYQLQQAVGNALRAAGQNRPLATLLTQVVVDPLDPAFAAPSKPVGRFYGRDEAKMLSLERGWTMAEDAGRGYRRVVPSPLPIEIVEWPTIRGLLAAGTVVVAAGGGGIPVVRETDGSLRGVEAVIDKDRASALLALLVHADLLVILTAVPEVRLDFRLAGERPLRRVSVAQAREYLARSQFAAGSMGPKVEAAADFTAASGRPALITSPERLLDALAGTAGTTFVP